LRAGEAEKTAGLINVNVYVSLIEDAQGLDKIEELQSHENTEVCEKAVNIFEKLFSQLR
jgi:importin subunit alpha-1